MKVRLSFVTNSSSSSYVCEICDESEEAWDRPDWMVYCKNDHSICDEHLLTDEIEKDEDGCVDGCPICALKAYSITEMKNYLLKTRKVLEEEVFAEIKKANKRRRKLYDIEYIQYVFKKSDLDEDKIMEEIRSNFKNWYEFYYFVYGRRSYNDPLESE